MKKYVFFILVIAALAFSFINPQRYLVKGSIIDDKGNPLSGVSIQVKDGKETALSDAAGNFSISVIGKDVLVFSYLGFLSQQVSVNNRKTFKITLVPAATALQEVVVVGYGKAKRNLMTASSATPIMGRAAGVITGQSRVYYNGSKRKKEIDRTKEGLDREGYDAIVENPFLAAKDNPLSTFSIDVDAASYSNVRRLLNANQLPPSGAVRIEEMINYFSYQYPQPKNDDPFSVNMEMSSCPWNEEHKLVLIGLQGRKISAENLPASNLVFLIDVSGSMMMADKLPLVKASMKLLVDQLRPQDKVAMVVYAGSAGLVLPSTNGSNKTKIKESIDALEAGGSTAGGEGIKLAYKLANESFIKGANNRVVLCTDGDFNVGVSSDGELEKLIEVERESGVFLTVLGFGTGNYQDAKMQKLADKGNGNHGYIDNLSEAKKMLVKEFGGTIFTIAKDVKLQIEFNPTVVQGYRLIGYENRMLAKEDFNDDAKDAGELGSGHTVTALYEIIPAGIKTNELKNVDELRYQSEDEPYSETPFMQELMYVKLRYKQPDGNTSKLMEFPLNNMNSALARTSENFRFAASVAAFGMLLIDSKYKGKLTFDYVHHMASNALGKDEEGYRKQFLELVAKAGKLKADVGLSK